MLEQKAVRDAILYITDTQAIGEQKIANAQKDSGVKEQKAAVDQLSKAYAQFYKVQEEMARTKPDTEHYRNLEGDLNKAQEGILDAISVIDALDVSAGVKEALVAKAQASAEVAKAAKKLRDTTAKEADKQVQKEADAIKAASDAKRKAAEEAKKAREDERKAAEKAADDEARAYEEAEARKAAALEKAKKAQQEYNLAELNKRNEERAAYENWWEQALLDQEKEMFDAPEAAITRIKKAYEELFKVQKKLEAAKEGTAEYDSLAAEEQRAREAVSSALSSIDALNATEAAKKALVNEAIEAARTTKAYQDLHAARTKREEAADKKRNEKDLNAQNAAVKALTDAFTRLHKARKNALKEQGTPLGDKYADDVANAAKDVSDAIAAINNLPISKELKKELIEQAKAAKSASDALNKYNEERLRMEGPSEDTAEDDRASRREEVQKRQRQEVEQLANAIVALNNAKAKLATAEYGTAEWDNYASAVSRAHDAVEAAKDAMVHPGVTEETIKRLVEQAEATDRVTQSEDKLREAQAKAETARQKEQKSDKDIALDAIKEEISLTTQLNDLRKRQAQEKSASGRAEYDDNIRAIEQMIAGYRDIYTEILRNNSELLDNEDILR